MKNSLKLLSILILATPYAMINASSGTSSSPVQKSSETESQSVYDELETQKTKYFNLYTLQQHYAIQGADGQVQPTTDQLKVVTSYAAMISQIQTIQLKEMEIALKKMELDILKNKK